MGASQRAIGLCCIALAACSHDGEQDAGRADDFGVAVEDAAPPPDMAQPRDFQQTRPMCYATTWDTEVFDPGDPGHSRLLPVVTSLATGDFNGDGHQDLVETTAPGLAGLFLQRGHGDGTFGPLQSLMPPEQTPRAITLDADGDRRLDVMAVGLTGASLFRGAGDGTFTRLPVAGSTYMPVTAVSGDFNGDGKADFVVSRTWWDLPGQNQSFALLLYLGHGDGSFSLPVPIDARYFEHLEAADLDGDGRDDLVGSTGWTLAVFRGQRAGGLASSMVTASSRDIRVPFTIADLDGDHVVDLAFGDSVDRLTSHVYLARGHGDGTFAPPLDATPFLPASWLDIEEIDRLITADLDGDRALDLVVVGRWRPGDGHAYAAVLPNHGDGTFEITDPEPLLGHRLLDAAAADWNGDGHPDVAFSMAIPHYCPDCADTPGIELWLSRPCGP